MSEGVLAGWAETVSLSATASAIVATRRGKAELRFPDEGALPAMELNGIVIAGFETMLRSSWRSRDVTMVNIPLASGDRMRVLAIELVCAEPLIALMQRALRFAEGREG